jgi:hypothetical protein
METDCLFLPIYLILTFFWHDPWTLNVESISSDRIDNFVHISKYAGTVRTSWSNHPFHDSYRTRNSMSISTRVFFLAIKENADNDEQTASIFICYISTDMVIAVEIWMLQVHVNADIDFSPLWCKLWFILHFLIFLTEFRNDCCDLWSDQNPTNRSYRRRLDSKTSKAKVQIDKSCLFAWYYFGGTKRIQRWSYLQLY